MTSKNLADLYKKQVSLSEWFADIDHKQTETFRKEDNWKRDRMEELSKLIPFPFDKPTSFETADVVNRSTEFVAFLNERGTELCALRLIPKQDDLQKLRMRGMSIRDVVKDWLPKQDIKPEQYQADFVPHPKDNVWATIFVVTSRGIIGEIIKGGHNQLTQGFHDDENQPIRFSFDFTTLETDPKNKGAEKHLQEIFSFLHVKDKKIKQKISGKFDIPFDNDWLPGYFETVSSTDQGLWFIDWNRVLGKLYKDFWVPISSGQNDGNIIQGTIGAPGTATGTAKIVHPNNISSIEFDDGDILICLMTSPDYVPLMKHAGAVVTQEGGILSHAAIISREMKVPCLVGVNGLLDQINDGDMVEINANKGTIKILK